MLHRFGLAIGIVTSLVTSPQEPATKSGTGTVIVTVLEAGTRAPIKGAHVSGGSWDGGLTGADGRLRVVGVKPGSYWLHVTTPEHLSSLRPEPIGYVRAPPPPSPRMPITLWRAQAPEDPGVAPLSVDAGQDVEVEFVLPRGAAITGRAVTPDGTPVAGATVSILEAVSETGESRTYYPRRTRVTEADGGFRVAGLLPSTYYIRVTTAPDGPESVPIFHPSETSPVKAAAIVVRGSETADLKVVVRDVAPVPISGSVLDSNGRPVKGEPLGPLAMQQPAGVVDLWYRRLDRDCCPHTTTNELIEIGPDGRFRTKPLPPGRYLFVAGKYWMTVVHESRANDDVVIRMERPAIVRGAATPPPAWGTSRGPSSVSLEPIESSTLDHLVQIHRTDALPDGSFGLAAVPGRYRLRFYSPDPGMIVQHIWLDDGLDVADSTVDLKPGELRENVRITLTDRLARIVGRIGPPFLLGPRGYSVIAFPADPQHRHNDCSLVRRSENEEGGGLFFVERLLPGFDYFVAVYPRGESQPSLDELSKTAVRLSINEATVYKIDIDLEKR